MSKKYSLSDYLNSDCKLKIELVAGLYDLTGGRPCDGCAFNTGCKALQAIKNFNRKTVVKKSGFTNLEYSKANKAFLNACILAKCLPTQRQASKFRMGKGIAYGVAVAKTMEPLKTGEPGRDPQFDPA